MASLEIPCPQCGAHLKVPDRRLLGRKGKCRKCGHQFILEDPAPPPLTGQFEMAGVRSGVEETLVGEFTKSVPELPPEAIRTPSPAAPPRPLPPQAFSAPPPIPSLEIDDALTAPSPLSKLRKNRKRGNGILIGGILAAAAIGGIVYVMTIGSAPSRSPKSAARRTDPDDESARPAGKKAVASKKESDREAIDLSGLPDGVEVVVHLRPAELWSDEVLAREFRFALGPLAKWLEDEETKVGFFRSECFQDPRNIEEIVIGLVPQVYPTPPDVCWVVRATRNVRPSELIDAFKGELQQVGPREVFVAGNRAYAIKDPRIYASCPAAMMTSMIENIDQSAKPRDEIESLLEASDRSRLLTISGINDTLYQHQETVVPANLQKALVRFLDWCSSDVKAFSFSIRMDAEEFDSEILLAVDRTRSVRKLKARFEESLQSTPREILEIVQQTHPETLGIRKLVGRFPAMVKAYAMETAIEEEQGFLALRTILPQRAAPNLAAAGLLAWDLTNRANFRTAHPEPAETTGPDSSMTIAERLRKNVPEVEFKDEMMYNCFNFIGEEIGVKFKLEGDDLKMAAVTQNMKQNFAMKNVPATDVIGRIVTPLKLCIVIDEEHNLVHVTSLAAAETRGWKPFPLK